MNDLPLERLAILRHGLAASLLTLIALPALGAGLDLNLNDESARLAIQLPLGRTQLQIDPGWLYNDDNGNVAHLGFQLVDTTTFGGVKTQFGLGAKAFYLDAPGDDGYALGVGGFAHLRIPGLERLGVGGRIYFAPDVIAFGDATQFLEAGVRVSYNLVESAYLYAGYQFVDARFDSAPDTTFDSSLHVGFRFAW